MDSLKNTLKGNVNTLENLLEVRLRSGDQTFNFITNYKNFNYYLSQKYDIEKVKDLVFEIDYIWAWKSATGGNSSYELKLSEEFKKNSSCFWGPENDCVKGRWGNLRGGNRGKN